MNESKSKSQQDLESHPQSKRPAIKEHWYTCSKCGKIGQYTQAFNDAVICPVCLDDVLHGADRAVCKERGYHETDICHADINSTIRIICKCTQRARTKIIWGEPLTATWEQSSMIERGFSWSTNLATPQIPDKWIVQNGYAVAYAHVSEPPITN